MARSIQVILLAVLCVGTASTAFASGQQSPSDKNNFCQGCRAVVSFARTFNTSDHRSAYEDTFKNFCELYYPVSTDYQQGSCPLLIKSFFYVLDHVDPVHHCDQIGACGSTLDAVYTLAPELQDVPPKQADVLCKFCEQSVEQVQSALMDPQTIDQVRRQADQLCEYLKMVDADKECRQLTNKYLDQAVDFVRHLDPLAYCRSIQMCSAQAGQARPLAKKSGASRSRVLNSQNKLPTLADFSDFGIETSVSIGGVVNGEEAPIYGIKNQQVKATPGCMLCKTLVKEMFHFLRENRTEANIVSGLKQVCQTLFSPGSEKLDECQSMVSAYTKELIQLLIDETDPEMICMILEQCVGRTFVPAYQLINESPKQQRPVAARKQSIRNVFNLGDLIHSLDPSTKLKSARVCFECKMFIKYLRNVMDEPGSRESMKDFLVQNLCLSIPNPELSEQCRRLVEEYSDTFFAAVIGNLNPSSACTELGACTRKTLNEVLHIDLLAPADKPDEVPSFIFSPKPTKTDNKISNKIQDNGSVLAREQQQATVTGPICDQCVNIVTSIDEYLAQHPINQDVSVLIDQVCNKMPSGSVRDECVYLIEMFGTEIAEAVSSMENPKQLCSKIMLC